MIVDVKGIPLGITVDAANRHDMKMTKTTLQSIVVHRPKPTIIVNQHMCLYKGYDYPKVYELLEYYGFAFHILITEQQVFSDRFLKLCG